MTKATTMNRERADLLETLRIHRAFLHRTAHGLRDEDARRRSTVSALTIGGIVKHVAAVEGGWAQFMTGAGLPGADVEVDWANPNPEAVEQYEQGFTLLPHETLSDMLVEYRRVASATDELVATIADLDTEHPLPTRPWFPPGSTRSVRRTIVHIVAETAQHAGHADIIREAIDGQKTMG